MSESFIAEKTEQFIRNSLEKVIKDSINPDALTSLLFSCRNGNSYISSASIKLGISEEEVKKMIFDELLPFGLVKVHGEGNLQEFHIIDEVGELIIPPLGFGPYSLIDKRGLNQEQVVKAMDSVLGLIEFTCYKRFKFDLKTLRELREKSHKALESLRKDEAIFFHTTLGVPTEYNDFPSFVHEVDPTRVEGYTQNIFELRGKFDSPRRAFEVGLDYVNGSMILKKKFLIDCREANLSPGGIHISREDDSWKLNLENVRYDAAMRGSVEYNQAVGEAISNVQRKLEEALK